MELELVDKEVIWRFARQYSYNFSNQFYAVSESPALCPLVILDDSFHMTEITRYGWLVIISESLHEGGLPGSPKEWRVCFFRVPEANCTPSRILTGESVPPETNRASRLWWGADTSCFHPFKCCNLLFNLFLECAFYCPFYMCLHHYNTNHSEFLVASFLFRRFYDIMVIEKLKGNTTNEERKQWVMICPDQYPTYQEAYEDAEYCSQQKPFHMLRKRLSIRWGGSGNPDTKSGVL